MHEHVSAKNFGTDRDTDPAAKPHHLAASPRPHEVSDTLPCLSEIARAPRFVTVRPNIYGDGKIDGLLGQCSFHRPPGSRGRPGAVCDLIETDMPTHFARHPREPKGAELVESKLLGCMPANQLVCQSSRSGYVHKSLLLALAPGLVLPAIVFREVNSSNRSCARPVSTARGGPTRNRTWICPLGGGCSIH